MQKIIQKSYVDLNGKIDALSLRQDVKVELDKLKIQIEYLLGGTHRQFWELLHHHLVRIEDDNEKQQYLEIEAQLTTLPEFIETWIKTAVETLETFDLFVMIKASEVKSGNKDGDYFWALAIRHDQLLGLTRVIKALTENLNRWVTMQPNEVMTDGVFWGISQYNIEKQIYLESEKVHQERLGNGHSI
jgi:hypothetical protein